MSAYTIYKELFPPQAVEHVKRAHFTSPDKINLIVAKSSLLQVYDFVEFTPSVDGFMHDATNGFIEADGEETGEVEEDDTEAQERFHGQDEQALVYPKLRPLKKNILGTNSGRLELVAQYKLNGNVATMGVIRTCSPRGKQGCDSILLGFNDAKMSLLEWSPSTNNIVTVSIHYYERDELKKEFLANPYAPDIHIDPQQRCAVFNFYGDKLAVLPFKQSESMGKDYGGDENRHKWPYSPSFVVDLESIDRRIKNVIDMSFLEGYYEPTLAILFQTTQTWTGRLASSKDTVSVVVISLDLSARIYPIIYSLDNLPYDCHKLVAMPRPVNGLLIIAANSILHVSQGSPGVGVAVNGYCKAATDFSGMIYNDEITQMGLSLDGARAMTVVGGLCLLFLQTGEWVVVKPTLDGSKVVGMELTKIDWPSKATSTRKSKRSHAPNPKIPLALVPTCVTSVKDGEYFFLGSRVGDSLLIKWRNTNSAKLADTAGMAFRVCDVLLNTGPILDMAIGQAEDEQVSTQNTADLELVTCSGHDKNGGLCVFQRHARPETTFSFEQPGSESVWSIKCRKEQYFEGVRIGSGASGWEANSEEDDPFFEMYDKLLFISKSTQTLILATGEELQELEHTDFYTAGPTVAVGTVLNHTKIVQIQANAVLLLSPSGKLSQTINLKQSIIVDACIQDPYVLLRMDNSSITVLKVDPTTRQLASTPLPSHVNSKNVSMASIFIDTSGIFSRISEKRAEQESKRQRQQRVSEKKRKAEDELLSEATAPKKPYSKRASISEFDEIDMDLYGDQDEPDDVSNFNHAANKSNPFEAAGKSAFDEDDDDDEDLYGESKTLTEDQMEEPDTQGEVDEINVSIKGNMTTVTKKTYWCLIYGNDRVLRIYSLPDLEECFSMPQFNMLRGLVIDRPADASALSRVPTSASAQQFAEDIIDDEPIQEILLANIGRETKHPHLIVRTNTNDIIIYKAFTFLPDPANDHHDADEDLSDYHAQEVHENRLALRFSRLHHEYVSRSGNTTEESHSTEKMRQRQQRLLIPFQNVAGYTGVFMAGPQPAWLICSCKSFVRVHPMKPGKHSIVGFTQFHNINCNHGFITVDSSARLCLSRLPTDCITYDMDWIMRKVPLGKTAHKIVYHPTMKVYSALVSYPKPVLLRNDDGNPIDGRDESSRNKGEFLPVVESFSLIMISPVTWEIVDTYDFQEYEQGLSLHCSLLESKQTSSGKKHFISVGTGFLRGEDTAMRGSIHVFDIIEVVPEPDNPQTNHKYKQLHTEEVKGAVSAVCDVTGHLVSCIGSKVIIWSFEDNESLVGVAFIDVQIYVTSIASIKNFIVLGDAQKSVWFLGFQLEPAKLALLGKDYQSFEVSSVDFIIDDKSLYLLVGDTDDNLDIFQYAPFNLQSFAGQKLLRRGDFHVGSQVRSMVRLPQIIHKSSGIEYSRKHFCICATFAGSISIVSPIPEKTFKRLNTLYGQLVNGLQHVAGLNPRAYRLMKGPKQRMSSNRTKAVLDGDLIFHFAGLSINRQREMTKQIGTTVPRIMEDLVEIDSSIDHF